MTYAVAPGQAKHKGALVIVWANATLPILGAHFQASPRGDTFSIVRQARLMGFGAFKVTGQA